MKCKYDKTVKATDKCSVCGCGLCDICGYVDDTGLKYCNECWEDIQDQMNEDRIANARDMQEEHEASYFNNEERIA